MNSRLNFLASLFILFFAVACGKPSSSTGTIPTAADPGAGTPGSSPIASPTNTPDPRLPNMTGSVAVNLTDHTTYNGLRDFNLNIFDTAYNLALPLVGDPQFVMHLPNTAAVNLFSGDMALTWEDQWGLWGFKVNTFAQKPKFLANENLLSSDGQYHSYPNVYHSGFTTAVHAGTTLDMIFSAPKIVVHVVATQTAADASGNDLVGTIYYRIPTGTETQCSQATENCAYYAGYNPAQPASATNPFIVCSVSSNTTTNCSNYMSTTNSAVKNLGTFRSKYSNWTTLSEGQ